jgi:hypothetical protein
LFNYDAKIKLFLFYFQTISVLFFFEVLKAATMLQTIFLEAIKKPQFLAAFLLKNTHHENKSKVMQR